MGLDRSFTSAGTTWRIGGIGSISSATIASDATSDNSTADRTFSVNGSNPGTFGSFNNLNLVLPDVTSTSTSSSKLKLRGLGGGLTWSTTRGKLFWDGVAKIDVMNASVSGSSVNSVVDIAGGANATPATFIKNNPADFTGYVFDRNGAAIDLNNLGPGQLTDGQACLAMGTDVVPGDQGDRQAAIQNRVAGITFNGANSPFGGLTQILTTSVANTVGFTNDLGRGFILEPTVTVRYTHMHVGDPTVLGYGDGQVIRLEAGGKLSHLQAFRSGDLWTNTIGLYVYSDVWVDGFVVATNGASFKGDQGLVRLRGVLQSKLQFADGLQLYGELNGRVGEDYYAIGGKAGLRIEW